MNVRVLEDDLNLEGYVIPKKVRLATWTVLDKWKECSAMLNSDDDLVGKVQDPSLIKVLWLKCGTMNGAHIWLSCMMFVSGT